ncbi:hypothetical protein N7532_004612 [Penicillium argentinense]|uniref:Uncharacterized protein n=1 Tax=Penicillium argentinense TaxID=1131581 RepID=A0A9W9KFT9_9EURO|nr:uncharacterized protein N7532_004612 [Penicillium argentinense]KAJ5104083.1 hypothetical protein N7532_004612 [Penicillium argentinense]
MTSLLRLQPRLRTSASLTSLSRSAFIYHPRTYSQGSSVTREGDKNKEQNSSNTQSVYTPNHPIPSNKAEPTLRDGLQSPIADYEGNLREDLPKDVKEHNEDMEHRYDRPYNRVDDEGNVKESWKRD